MPSPLHHVQTFVFLGGPSSLIGVLTDHNYKCATEMIQSFKTSSLSKEQPKDGSKQLFSL